MVSSLYQAIVVLRRTEKKGLHHKTQTMAIYHESSIGLYWTRYLLQALLIHHQVMLENPPPLIAQRSNRGTLVFHKFGFNCLSTNDGLTLPYFIPLASEFP